MFNGSSEDVSIALKISTTRLRSFENNVVNTENY
jgi:hypothetical protein